MAHYDGMREATEAGNESQRQANVYRTPREALDSQCRTGRRATDKEVVQWLADLQARGEQLDADDSYIFMVAQSVIERLTKELQRRDRFLDQRIDNLTTTIQRTRYRYEDLRERRDELTVVKTENKRIQEHLNKAQ